MKIWKSFNLLILFFEIVFISAGTFYKHIAFGSGLGDLLWYGFIYILLLIHLILTWKNRNKSEKYFLRLSIIYFLIFIWICLEATIWRNAEYRWNGKLFYGSLKKVTSEVHFLFDLLLLQYSLN